MKLVLAEKPSVAQSIAKVLGAAKREDGYLEGNGYVVSWCVGHLVELAQPEVYDAKYSKWAHGYIFYIGGCTMAEMRKRTSMSVLEMGRMLGLGKTESYWLIKKNYFKTILVGNTMRVMIDSFEEWYANQFKYQKVDGTPPGEELKKTTYSMEELGQRLGLKEATAYELVAKGHFDVVDVLGKRRVTKESFERWYASQTDYRTVEDQELDADIMASTYGLPEMARMLGVHRQTIYYIVANEDFELIKVGRYKRATKESFEKWYHNQTRYQLAEDRQERS